MTEWNCYSGPIGKEAITSVSFLRYLFPSQGSAFSETLPSPYLRLAPVTYTWRIWPAPSLYSRPLWPMQAPGAP